MKIEIPPPVKPIYDRLSSRFNLEIVPLSIRGKTIKILKPSDIEALLPEEGPLKKIEDFPFWVKIWEASIVLADFIAGVKPDGRVLELGAGLGVAGLAAAAFGHEVVITDSEEDCLDFVRLSAALNDLSTVKVEKLDWRELPDLGKFEIIIGAEIVFSGRYFESLFKAFRQYLAPGGVIYLAHNKERMRTLAPFLYLAEKEYEEAVSQRNLRAEDEVHEIIISRLIPKTKDWEGQSNA